MTYKPNLVHWARSATTLGDATTKKAKSVTTPKRRGHNTLSDEQVALIKRDLKEMRVIEVAIKHNVNPHTVGNIAKEICYAEVKPAKDEP